MDITEKLGIYLNEASTLTALGVTPAQIKAIYSRTGYGKYVPDANAKWDKVNSKKAVKDLLKANNTYSPAVVGFDPQGNLFLVRWIDHRNEYHVSKWSPEGEELSTWSEKSPQKALSYFSSVRDYYVANQGTVDMKGSREMEEGEPVDNSAHADMIAKVINKEAQKLFMETRMKVTTKVNGYMKNGDFTSAFNLLKGWVEKPNIGDATHDSSLKQMVMNSWSARSFRDWIAEVIARPMGGISSFGRYPEIDRILKQSSPDAHRKAGAEVLREIKERLAKYSQ